MNAFAWGCGRYGQLGNGVCENQPLPVKMELPISLISKKGDESPRNVTCGLHCTFIITNKGNVYSCGMGRYGRIGAGSQKDHLFLVPIQIPSQTVSVSSKFTHSCATDTSGEVYCWGSTQALGFPIIHTSSTTSTGAGASHTSNTVMGAGQASASMNDILLPATIDIPLLDARDQVKNIACGHNFTFVVTEAGMVFSWGNGRHGVLGHGTEDNVARPKLIESIRSFRVIRAECGAIMSALISEEGKLFTAGCTKEYALGHGPIKGPIKEFKLVDTLLGEIVTGCSCSTGEHHRHMLACTESGLVYSWGDGSKGKLGHGDQHPREWPLAIDREHFLGQNVIKVVAGGLHSMALTRNGFAFTWGCGSDGRLGHKESIGRRYLYREDLPRLVDSLAVLGPVIDIDSSYYHCAAIVDTKFN